MLLKRLRACQASPEIMDYRKLCGEVADYLEGKLSVDDTPPEPQNSQALFDYNNDGSS